jgi:hypothetical protein
MGEAGGAGAKSDATPRQFHVRNALRTTRRRRPGSAKPEHPIVAGDHRGLSTEGHVVWNPETKTPDLVSEVRGFKVFMEPTPGFEPGTY